MLSRQGAFGSLSAFHSSFGEREMLQLATDAVERLNRDPEKLVAPPELRAGILSRLATRSLYRGDLERAKAYGTAARELDEAESADGIRVLRVLADRAGETDRVLELDKEILALRYGSSRAYGVERDFLLAETRRKPRDPKTDPVQGPAEVERHVRSLVRLCLEPVHHLFADATVRDETVAEIALSAKVYPDGRVELDTSEASEGSLAEVNRCARQLAARVFAHAPSSVRARVSVKSMRPPRGGLFGSELEGGIGFGGLGGLGTRGSGGLGTRGSGGLGTRGIGGLGNAGGGNIRGPGTAKAPKQQP
jgi:hypothetical protein